MCLKLPDTSEYNDVNIIFLMLFYRSPVSPLGGNVAQTELLCGSIVPVQISVSGVQNWDIQTFVNQMSNFLLRK